MKRIYAKINKVTLKELRKTLGINFEYIKKKTNFSEEKISLWEDESNNIFPTINQAKSIAKCYHIPFAGLYMNYDDINVNVIPRIKNMRSGIYFNADDSIINLITYDLCNARSRYMDLKSILAEDVKEFNFEVNNSINAVNLSKSIRSKLELSVKKQRKFKSSRKLYLFIKDKLENIGIFVYGFDNVSTDTVRGIAIYKSILPIIGVNNDDRYPAKSFTLLHETVHIIKRLSAVCNDYFSDSLANEEVFCNLVAGNVLAPSDEVINYFNKNEITINSIDNFAKTFSISSEVTTRRLYDLRLCTKEQYIYFSKLLLKRFNDSKERLNLEKDNGKVNIFRKNVVMKAIDKTSSEFCRSLVTSYANGKLDKFDIMKNVGIEHKNVNKFVREVIRCYP